jgi:hypothetical protein
MCKVLNRRSVRSANRALLKSSVWIVEFLKEALKDQEDWSGI